MTSSERTGAKLFVSYSRTDRLFVDRLVPALSERGHDVWIDVQDIRPSEEWLQAIYTAIQQADAFVFVVSSDSVDPVSVCIREIAHAARHNKRIIPVVCRPVDPRSVPVPEAVGRLNWVFFLEAARFEASLGQLVSAIETDLEWVRSHTRVLERAVEWDAAKRDDSFVLQKNDLAAAERWLALGPTKEPNPTGLQTEYVIESRAVATRRQRRLLLFGVAAALLVGVGITVALYQYAQAEDRRTQALARELAAEAQFEVGRRLELAIPLSLQALTTRALPESRDSAISVGQASFNVVRILRGHTDRVVALCIVAGGRHLVSVARDGRVILWDVAAGAPVQRLMPDTTDELPLVACSPSTPVVAVATPAGALTLGRVDANGMERIAHVEDLDGVSRLQFSGDGAVLATIGTGPLKLRSGTTGEVVGAFEFEDGIAALALSQTGHIMAIGTPAGRNDAGEEDGGEVSMWTRNRPTPLFSKAFLGIGVGSIAVDGDGTRVIVADIEGGVTVWDGDGTAVEVEVPAQLDLSDSPVSVFDSNGEQFMAADGRAAVIMRLGAVPNSFERVQRLAGHARAVTAVALSASDGLAATGSEEGTILVHTVRGDDDLDGGKRVVDGDKSVIDVAFGPGDEALMIEMSEPAPRRRVLRPVPFALPSSAAHANVPPAPPMEARRFAVVLDGEKVVVRDSQGGSAPSEIIPQPGESAVAGAVTPDGRYAVAASENLVRIARAGEPGTLVGALPAGFGLISAVAVSADGRLLAVAGGDAQHALARRFGMWHRSIVLVDIESGRTVGRPLQGINPADITRLEFSADGQRLVSFSPEEAIVWIVGTQLWLERACAAVDVAIDSDEWERRLAGVAYPASCNSQIKQGGDRRRVP